MISRSNVFQPKQLASLTADEEMALSQSIKHGKSHLNSLASDHRDYFKKKLREHSVNFDNQTIRDGVELRKDGLIITSKGIETDVKFLEEDDPKRLLN